MSTTNEDLLVELETLFAYIGETNEAVATLIKQRDKDRETMLAILDHCKRLLKKDEDMMRAMGIYGLVKKANEESAPSAFEQEIAPEDRQYWNEILENLAPRIKAL